jgi:hypothetical protein
MDCSAPRSEELVIENHGRRRGSTLLWRGRYFLRRARRRILQCKGPTKLIAALPLWRPEPDPYTRSGSSSVDRPLARAFSPARGSAQQLWLEPDHVDLVLFGRSIVVWFDADRRFDELSQDLGLIACEIDGVGFINARAGGLLGGGRYQTARLTVHLGPLLTPQLAELLLRFGVNHLRRVGVPLARGSSVAVMTDPFEFE